MESADCKAHRPIEAADAAALDLPAPGTLQGVSAMRRALRNHLSTLAFPQEAADDLQLALAEVGNNIVLHGKPPASSLRIHVDFDRQRFRLEIQDDGGSFPDFDARMLAAGSGDDGLRDTGFGLDFIRKSVDTVEYLPGCPNRLVLTRRLAMPSHTETSESGPAIDASAPDIERVYLAAKARGIRVLGILGVSQGDGSKALAQALAERSSRAGESTLLLDLSRPVDPVSDHSRWEPGDGRAVGAVVPDPNGFDRLTAIACARSAMRLRSLDRLKHLLDKELSHYRAIVVDVGLIGDAASASVPAPTAAQACEGIMISATPGTIARHHLESAMDALGAARKNVIGIVLDDTARPTVGEEAVDLVRRLTPYLPRIAKRLERWLQGRSLLWVWL